MLLIFGFACAFFLSCLWYMKPKMYNMLLTELYYNSLYMVIGMRDYTYELINRKSNKIALPHMPHKIAIVTGGSRGIGAEITKLLLQCGMEVIIACRTPSAGEKLICEIRESGITSGKAKVFQLDNASLKSVHKFANEIKQNYNKIHILINNAGVMFTPNEVTKDGFEQQWGVNYLSHFLLTALLLPLLKTDNNSEDCNRVVNVSSCAHLIGFINFEDINYKKNFNTYAGYAQSKLAQIMSMLILQELFDIKQLNIKIFSVHPGIVATDLFLNSYLKSFKYTGQQLFKTPKQGAISVVYAALSDEIKNRGGAYLSNCKEQPIKSLAFDKSIQERLFKLSLDQVQLKDFFQYLK